RAIRLQVRRNGTLVSAEQPLDGLTALDGVTRLEILDQPVAERILAREEIEAGHPARIEAEGAHLPQQNSLLQCPEALRDSRLPCVGQTEVALDVIHFRVE